MRTLFHSAAALLLSWACVEAAAIRVPSDQPTVDAGLRIADAGDTVLVAPGTYTNCDLGPCLPHVAVLRDGVTLLSEQGPDETILRADVFAGDDAVVRAQGISDRGAVLEGFTIASSVPGFYGLFMRDCRNVRVERCRFVDLGVPLQSGVHTWSRTHVRLLDCVFRGCGRGVFLGTGNVEIDGCRFEECSDRGADLRGWTDLQLAVRNSVFRDNTSSTGPSALEIRGFHFSEISGNVFENNGGEVCALRIRQDPIVPGAAVALRDNTFLNNGDSGTWAGAVFWNTTGEIVGNTFRGNAGGTYGAAMTLLVPEESEPTTMTRNVFAGQWGAPAVDLISDPSQLEGGCNLFWDNAEGDFEGYQPAASDQFLDPQFCAPSKGTVTVASSSPCLPENTSGVCGLIGAQTAGCPGVGTVVVALGTVPDSLSMTVDGTPVLTPSLHNWIPGADHVVSLPSQVLDGLGTRYDFVDWLDGGDTLRTITTPPVPAPFTAFYDSLFFLGMSAERPGEGILSPASGWRLPFTAIQISASGSGDLYFKRWDGEGEGSFTGYDSVATIDMLRPITQVAQFQKLVDVTLDTDPSGLVLEHEEEEFSAPRTFAWERDSGQFFSTEPLQVDPEAGARYRLLSWTNGVATQDNFIVVPEEPWAVTGLFETEYELTFEPTSQGSTTPGTGWWDAGGAVPIEASPNPYYLFTEWVGTGAASYSGPANPVTITMDSAVHQEARYRRMAQEVTLSLSDSDPFVHAGGPLGFGEVHLWYVCSTEGKLSRFEGDVGGSIPALAFLPAPGVFNAGIGTSVELATTECLTGPARLGSFLVQDDAGGELTLVPSPGNGRLAGFDCVIGNALPFEWPLDLRVTGVRTDGGVVSSSGRGCDEDSDAVSVPPGGDHPAPADPLVTRLGVPSPNPFAGRTRLSLTLDREAPTSVTIYDVSGRRVRRLVSARMPAGHHDLDWDGRDERERRVPSGVYFARLESGEVRQSRRLVLVRTN